MNKRKRGGESRVKKKKKRKKEKQTISVSKEVGLVLGPAAVGMLLIRGESTLLPQSYCSE